MIHQVHIVADGLGLTAVIGLQIGLNGLLEGLRQGLRILGGSKENL